MSAALRTQLAQAVVEALNGRAWPQTFTAVRKRAPVLDLDELDTLRVTVVPGSWGETRTGRQTSQMDLTVSIGVQQRLAQTAAEDPRDYGDDADALDVLVEDILDFLRGRTLAGAPTLAWLSSENTPYDPTHLVEFGVYTSVLNLTYRCMTTHE